MFSLQQISKFRLSFYYYLFIVLTIINLTLRYNQKKRTLPGKKKKKETKGEKKKSLISILKHRLDLIKNYVQTQIY